MLRYQTFLILLTLAGLVGCGTSHSAPKVVATQPATPVAPAHDAPPVLAATSVVSRGIAFTKGGDPVLQSLDVYAPRGVQGAPVVVFIHGGGWTRGDKGAVGAQPKLFNAAGIILIAVNYRLSPAVRHPAHVEDTAAAIAWTQKHIADYGGDGSKIVVMGHSAGVLMTALAAVDPRWLAPHGVKPTDLRGAVLLDGSVLDLPERIEKGGEKLAENCRRAFGPAPATHVDASPITHVRHGQSFPPFLLVYVKEGTLNHTQSKVFGEKLTACGGAAELVHIKGKTHASLVADLGTEQDALGERLLRFIRAVTEK